ncbi:MAG TPA: hypothetical protein P5555_21115 [Candidatus Paceibacterota bacterium]|nr:hypothetical protein [Candidatus Paceibacterota bacterium]
MLEIEHRVALRGVLVVIGRRVNVSCARNDAVGELRREEDLLNAAVRNILQGIKVLVVRRNLDAAFPSSGTVEVQSAWIIEGAPIHREMVVVEALIHWLRRADPDAIRTLGEGGSARTDALGLGRHNPVSNTTLRVDLRVLLAGLVQG